MKITVSGAEKEVKDGLTLPELIEMENVETPEYVTVSINEEFVESAAKDSTVLKDGDNVEFLYFMGSKIVQAESKSKLVCVLPRRRLSTRRLARRKVVQAEDRSK